MNIKQFLKNRNSIFIFLLIVAFSMVYLPVKILYETSNQGGYYSHIILIPFVSIFLIFQKRRIIFSNTNYSLSGLPFIFIGIILYLIFSYFNFELNKNDYVVAIVLSAVILVNGAFVLCYGMTAYKASLFPLLFLLLASPIPSKIMDQFINILQTGSTEISNILLSATGVPFLREGFVFHLPGINIEVYLKLKN